MANAFLKVDDLKKNFGPLPVIDGWNLELEKNERIAIIGPSGCGKTTFLKILANLDKDFSGKVEKSFKKIGFVFQEPRLIPWKSLKENLSFITDNVNAITLLLREMRLDEFENYLPSQLSGGMRQRANLVRAMAIDPDILILDEPFSSLDMPVKFGIIDDINSLWYKEGFAMITVTHDIKEAILMADRILILSKRPSKIIEDVKNTLDRRQRDISNFAFIEFESMLIKKLFYEFSDFNR